MKGQGVLMKETKGRTRSVLWLAAFLLGVLAATGAIAQDDESVVASVEVRLWAFSVNPNFFGYSTTNHHDETVFFVGQADSPDPVYTEPATPERSARDILLSREMRDAYGWNSEGNAGTTSPLGYWTVSVAESGPSISVIVSHGAMSAPIGSIDRILDPGGREYAAFELKETRWSDDGSVVVVVIHQSLEGEWPMQVDTAYGFSAPSSPDAPAPAPPAPE